MLPFMRSTNKSNVYTITSFGGINPSYSKKINELKDAKNMSSQKYPALCSTPSYKSDYFSTLKSCGSGFYDKLYTIRRESADTGNIYICSTGEKTKISSYTTAEKRDAHRKMAFMKNKLLVIPDNVIYHTDTKEVEEGNVSQTTTRLSAESKFHDESGTTLSLPMPDGIWYSASLTNNSIKSESGTYLVSNTGYRFYQFTPSDNFEVGDVITVKMKVKPIDADRDDAYYDYLERMETGFDAKIRNIVKTTHDTPKGEITEATEIVFDDNLLLDGGYKEVLVQNITIEKSIPDFVDICTFENRIWGITKDTIHTSKLGDPSEWNDFSVDSYGTLPSSCFKTGVETDRSFTAITAFGRNILAFKEDCIHKVYGSQPDEYTVKTIECCGVEEGAKETLAIVGGVLYYKGKDGIYAYNGGLPKLISHELSLENTKALYGGGDDRYYYISVIKNETEYMYVFDTYYGIWHIRDNKKDITGFVKTSDGIRIITKNDVFLHSSSYGNIWEFSLDFWTKEFESKHVTKISLRYNLLKDSGFNMFLENKHNKYLLTSVNQSGENKICEVAIPVTCGEDACVIFNGYGGFEMSSLSVEYKKTN